jgi:hypothetical protein
MTPYLDNNEHAHPNSTFMSPDVPDTYAFEALCYQLKDSAHNLLRLDNGPNNILHTMSSWHTYLAALQVALDRNSFDHIPNDAEGLSVFDLAKAAYIATDRAERVLEMPVTHRIFGEYQ